MSTEFKDDTFGLLQQDRDFPENFRSKVEFSDGQTIEVVIDRGNEDLSQVLSGAHKIYAELKTLEPKFRDAVADEYLPLYNEEWRDEEEISKEAFLAEMRLESVVILKEDSYTASLCYVVGELFSDHAINVSIDQSLQIRNTSLDG
jgi:hypothetical protein